MLNITRVHSASLFKACKPGKYEYCTCVALASQQSGKDNHNADKSLCVRKPDTKAPRSKSSIRIVSILESVIELLRKYRKEQLEYRLMIGNQWQGDNHVFIQWDGSQMYPSTPYSIFKDIIHRHNTRFGDKDGIRQAGPRTNKHHDEYIQPRRPMH